MNFQLNLDDLPNDQDFQSWVDALNNLNGFINPFKVVLKKEDRSKFRVIGQKRRGFAEEVIRVSELHSGKLPQDLDISRTKTLMTLLQLSANLLVRANQTQELIDDLDLALRNMAVQDIDHLYDALKSANNRDSSMDAVMAPLRKAYKRSKSTAQQQTTTTNIDTSSNDNSTNENTEPLEDDKIE